MLSLRRYSICERTRRGVFAYRAAVLLGLSAWCVLLTCAHGSPAGDFVVVVNPRNPQTQISASDLRQIFTGKKTAWDDGPRIELITQADTKVHDSFTRTVLMKSPLQFALYWKKLFFTGQGIPPAAADDRDVLSFVAARRGAIGYISPGSLDATVKVVEVIGR